MSIPAENALAPIVLILKEEKWTRIELLTRPDGAGRLFRKVYRVPIGLAWRTFLRRSRARREFDNLRAVHGAGLASIEPIAWDETRRLGCVTSCEITSVFVEGESVRTTLTRDLTRRERRNLCRQLGELLRSFHDAGYLWLTAVPRNLIRREDGAILLACDMPYCLSFGRPIHGSGFALVDLFSLGFSPSRTRDLSPGERRVLLLAYCDGQRPTCRRLWRTLESRSKLRQRIDQGMLRAGVGGALNLFSRLLSACTRLRRRVFSPRPEHPMSKSLHADSFMSEGKLQNYNSERGARAYRDDYSNKVHRKLSDELERKILARYFDRIGPVDTMLDCPCGAGRLLCFFQSRAKKVYEGDWSQTMLRLNREDHRDGASNRDGVAYVRCSALEIPFPDRQMDLVVSIRLSHHLEKVTDREDHLRELFRVADKAVIATWFSATSLKNRLRQLRVKLVGKRPKNTLHTARVRTIAAECGFRMVGRTPLSRLSSGHVFGLFLRP